MTHAAPDPVGVSRGKAEGSGVGWETELEAQEDAGAKENIEGTAVGRENEEEAWEVE